MTTTILLVIAIAAIQIVATPSMAAPVTGGYFPIANIEDPHVQQVGAWAVSEHVKKANDGLKFKKVVNGEVQVVAGLNYRLFFIDASDSSGKDARYKAEVFEKDPDNSLQLLSFGPVN